MVGEFRKFIERGNVLDLAVGVIIGAAFATVVKSFVDDILMPPIGAATDGVTFSELYLNLSGNDYATRADAIKDGAAIISYGNFINNLIVFLITAFAVFLLVKAVERMRRRENVAPPEPTEKDCPYCYTRIHVAASRCPACTTELAPIAVAGR
jgi:large conductance mechanosensitive channel